MYHLDTIYKSSNTPSEFTTLYFEYLKEIMDKINVESVGKVMEELLEVRQRNSKIFFMGNGGSAATAAHFVNDLSIGTKCNEKPFRAICLTSNMATVTALANDYGYDQIFKKQLQVLMREGDLVVAITASGNSENLLNALVYTKAFGNKTVGLTGFDGGKVKEICDFNIHIPTQKGEYGPVEDFHMIIDHLFCSYFSRLLLVDKKERAKKENKSKGKDFSLCM